MNAPMNLAWLVARYPMATVLQIVLPGEQVDRRRPAAPRHRPRGGRRRSGPGPSRGARGGDRARSRPARRARLKQSALELASDAGRRRPPAPRGSIGQQRLAPTAAPPPLRLTGLAREFPIFPTDFVGYSISSARRRPLGVRQPEPTSLTGASSWPSASATPHPTSPPRPPRARSASTNGSATRGACCSAIPRTSPRCAPPSSATSPRSSPSSTSATSR